MRKLVILGVDPGTIVTGYGIIQISGSCSSFQAVDYGCIKPPSRLKLTDRYLIIFEGMEYLLETHQPDVVVVETQYVHKNPQSAIKLGMARGIIILAAKRKGIRIHEYAPSKAKQAVVGNGRASKRQVQAMVKISLGLNDIPEPEDASDALALALCHAHACRLPHILGEEI